MDLVAYMVKSALSPYRELERQAVHARHQHELASRRAHQYELMRDLVRNAHRSPLSSGLSGGIRGAALGALAGAPISLWTHSAGPLAAGALVGTAGGGLAGSYLPKWSRATLADYASGRAKPVFYGGEHGDEVQEAALNRAQRQLIGRVVKGL